MDPFVPLKSMSSETERGRELYKLLVTYLGGQVVDPLSEAEKQVYGTMNFAVCTVLESYAQNHAPQAIDAATVAGWIDAAASTVPSKKEHLKGAMAYGKVLVSQCFLHRINGFQDVLGTISWIGQHPNANTSCHVLSFEMPGSCVLLTPDDHYAFPILFNGATCNLKGYIEEYDTLMGQKISAQDQFNFLRTGFAGSPNQLGLHVANWFSECDRNWNQLFLNLLMLTIHDKSTTETKAAGNFPMAGGGWKGHGSWGGGKNPNSPSGVTDDIKRWMVAVLIRTQILSRERWEILLSFLDDPRHLLFMRERSFLSHKLIDHFKAAIKQLL